MGESLFWPGGGSGSGGALVVTAPAGTTVTATNGVKAMTKAVNAEGVVTFRGLATGTWQLSCTDGTTTSTPVPVEIVADYTKTLAFFSATINVTFPAGSTCTATCGAVQLTATAAEQASGSAVFGVPNAGTWTITSTANDGSDNSTSDTVEITEDGQSVSVELSYWNGELYARGNEYENITGGWGLRYSEGTGGTVTVESERIIISANQGNTGSGSVVYAGPENLIDLTNFSVFRAKMTKVSGGTIQVSLSVAESVGSGPLAYSNEVALTANIESEITLDVRAISGEKAVYVSAANSGANGAAAEAALLECELAV